MRSQPSKKFSSFLRHPVAKSYNIYISSNTDPARNATLEELSFNAVVGILGHELGHVVQYLKRPMTDFAAYLFDKKMKKIIEREADQITINHGLGYALYDARYYSLHVSNRAKDKNESTLEFYYKAEEVLQATIRHFNDN